MTINDIQAAMRAVGSHWWDPDTMRFFGTRVVSGVYHGSGGVYFITSDKRYDDSRGFTIRSYNPTTHEVDTVGELAGYRHVSEAAVQVTALAGEGATADKSSHRPVSDVEQFLADLRTHGDPAKIASMAAPMVATRQLMKYAGQHHKLREDQCNGTNPCPVCNGADEDCEACDGTNVRGLASLKKQLTHYAKRFGVMAVVFSGDPRGCTVKLVFHDGATNDWGREGWCVPILG